MGGVSGSPEIYWVVGEGSDVGKTTIAAALIAFLNAEGERAIGFKPFAASLLHENIDFMFENYPGVPSKLFGRDAWHLAKASPLTDGDWIDLVVPTQLLCYPNWRSAILMRSGSASLNNVEYFCSERGRALRDRRDFRQIREREPEFPLIKRASKPILTSTMQRVSRRKRPSRLSSACWGSASIRWCAKAPVAGCPSGRTVLRSIMSCIFPTAWCASSPMLI